MGKLTQIYHEISVVFFPIISQVVKRMFLGKLLQRAENCKILVFAEQKRIFSCCFLVCFRPGVGGRLRGGGGGGVCAMSIMM